MLTDLLERLEAETYPPSLRCMLLGGGPAPKPLLETCVDKGIPVYQTYGMTENVFTNLYVIRRLYVNESRVSWKTTISVPTAY